MNKIIDHRHAHQLSDLYHKSDRSLCVLVKDSKEAKLLENELALYIDKIKYFPENEILPYDHFSIPENILKERFQIFNSLGIFSLEMDRQVIRDRLGLGMMLKSTAPI